MVRHLDVNISTKRLLQSFNSWCLCIYCRVFVTEQSLQGKMSPVQIKKKWENLKQKYKVSFFFIIVIYQKDNSVII